MSKLLSSRLSHSVVESETAYPPIAFDYLFLKQYWEVHWRRFLKERGACDRPLNSLMLKSVIVIISLFHFHEGCLTY